MKQFDLTQWCDFVRGLADEEDAGQMQEALLSGSETAHRTVEMLRQVASVIEADETQPVPQHAVRLAKAIGSLQRPMTADHAPEPQSLGAKLLRFLPFEITFDSHLEPAAAGTRSLQSQDRQVSFEAAGLFVDLRIERDGETTAVVGHVLQETQDVAEEDLQPLAAMPVISMHQGRILETTSTGSFGEFQSEGLPNEDLKICFLVDDGECIEFPISP